MILKKTATFLVAIPFFITACSKDSGPAPTADFTTATVGGNTHAPSTINFANSSTNADTYAWTFGDGGTSSDQNPSHKYSTSGTFNVNLNASSSLKSDSKSSTITIAPAYTKVTLSSIKLSSTNFVSAFIGYVQITNASNGILYTSSTFTIDPAAMPLSVNLSTPYTITNLSSTYNIEVWKMGGPPMKSATRTFLPTDFSKGETAQDSYPRHDHRGKYYQRWSDLAIGGKILSKGSVTKKVDEALGSVSV